MTNDEIIRLSENVGGALCMTFSPESLSRFVGLIAAKERAACIKILEEYKIPCGNSGAGELAADWTLDALENIRESIRARGDA